MRSGSVGRSVALAVHDEDLGALGEPLLHDVEDLLDGEPDRAAARRIDHHLELRFGGARARRLHAARRATALRDDGGERDQRQDVASILDDRVVADALDRARGELLPISSASFTSSTTSPNGRPSACSTTMFAPSASAGTSARGS